MDAQERSRPASICIRGLKDRLSQPKIVDDGHTVVWEIIGPEVGTNFFCLLFFEAGEAFWRSEIEEKGFKAKVRKIFRRLGWNSQPETVNPADRANGPAASLPDRRSSA